MSSNNIEFETQTIPLPLFQRLARILEQLENVGRDIDIAVGVQYGVGAKLNQSALEVRKFIDLIDTPITQHHLENDVAIRDLDAAVREYYQRDSNDR